VDRITNWLLIVLNSNAIYAVPFFFMVHYVNILNAIDMRLTIMEQDQLDTFRQVLIALRNKTEQLDRDSRETAVLSAWKPDLSMAKY
jgi:hypothetical protein